MLRARQCYVDSNYILSMQSVFYPSKKGVFSKKEKVLLKKEELMDYLAQEPVDVLATFGAGNIDRYIEPITDLLKSRL